MKFNLRHLLILLAILVLSVGFGFAFDATAGAVERHQNPRPEGLSPSVERYAREYGVPESVIWATMREGSEFASNARGEDGRIGLMQLTPEQFSFVCTALLGEAEKDAGMLYDPETNLRAGTAYLSYLFGKYGVWEHVFAAYASDPESVDAWLSDPENLSPQGVLTLYPDDAVKGRVKGLKNTMDQYNKLYSQS